MSFRYTIHGMINVNENHNKPKTLRPESTIQFLTILVLIFLSMGFITAISRISERHVHDCNLC
jgi:hypothetical protein